MSTTSRENMAFGKIKIDKNDELFSKMIRERDKYRCIFCGGQYAPGDRGIQNSHYWGRGHKMTRFLAINCDALCTGCHMANEGEKQGKYRQFKLHTLGEAVYQQLEHLHQQTGKYGTYEKELLYAMIKTDYKNKAHLTNDWYGYVLPFGGPKRVENMGLLLAGI